MAKIIIPTPLRKYTDQNRTFETGEDTLSGAIGAFTEQYPEVKNNLLDEDGEVRSYIKIYIGGDEVNPAKNGDITLQDDTEVSIVPAIAGGNSEYPTRNNEY